MVSRIKSRLVTTSTLMLLMKVKLSKKLNMYLTKLKLNNVISQFIEIQNKLIMDHHRESILKEVNLWMIQNSWKR